MMLRLAFHLLSVIFAIRGTISQEICCEKKTINNVEYKLTQDEVAANPSCMNGCIYQEVGNPSSYACFVDAYNEVGCSVGVQEQKLFLVSAGSPDFTHVEAVTYLGTSLCVLPDLPNDRTRQSMNEDILCGGSGKEDCLQFKEGGWTPLNLSLLHERYHHVSWRRPDGGVQLISGYGSDSYYTTEVVTLTESQPGPSLGNYRPVEACAIQLPEYAIITGGQWSRHSVKKIDENGLSADSLPDLNTGRQFHACGFYYKNNNLVYLVTGGFDGSSNIISTELLVESGLSWTDAGELPSARAGSRAISHDNNIFVIGGAVLYIGGSSEILSDILAFDKEDEKWIKTGDLQQPRYGHSVAIVPWSEVQPYCV